MSGRPLLCIDFDGVLHAYGSGWHGADVVADGPVPGAMDFLVRATEHFDVVVYSSRSKFEEGRRAMRRAIERWLGDEDARRTLPRLAFAHEKPAAFLTIDDRALCFTGTFPEIADLLAFKPWNAKEP